MGDQEEWDKGGSGVKTERPVVPPKKKGRYIMSLVVNKLTVKGLYGFLDKTIIFKPHVNILVGINGSGKTSILNLINWMLRPSIRHLCVTYFKEAVLDFNVEGGEHTITCKQTDKELTFNLKGPKTFNPLVVMLKHIPSAVSRNAELRENLLLEYSNLAPTKEEKETWDYLNEKISSPIVIELDRRLYTAEDEHIIFEERVGRRPMRRESPLFKKSPLDHVKELANTRYRKYRNDVISLNDRLKNKIMLSSFDSTFSLKDLSKKRAAKVSVNEVEKLESKVKTYLDSLIQASEQTRSNQPRVLDKELEKVNEYFQSLRRLLKKADIETNKPDIEILLMMNYNQFEKIRALIKEFEDFEKKSKKSYADIDAYLSILNSFFRDSAKELVYKQDTAELTYSQLDKNKKIVAPYLDLSTLSSGEKQILTLLTYLRFGEPEGQLFLVDEPELSLHPKWQADFLPAVKSLTSENTQLILATHSPEIVGSQEKECTVLLPYND